MQPLKGNWVRLIVAVAVASFVLVFVEVVTGLTTVVALRVATTMAGCKDAVSKMNRRGSEGKERKLTVMVVVMVILIVLDFVIALPAVDVVVVVTVATLPEVTTVVEVTVDASVAVT